LPLPHWAKTWALAQLCAQFELHPNQISEWRKQLLEGAANVFGGNAESAEPVDLVPLHAKIGQLALENDFLERALTSTYKSGFVVQTTGATSLLP
jgi:transposase